MTRIVGTRGSRRRSRFLLLVPFALLAVVAVTISGSAIADTATCDATTPPTRTLSGSAFEIDPDANLKVDLTTCIDWRADSTNTFRSGVAEKNDSASGSGDESFGKGTAEDNPNPTIVTGSIPPNKSDLKAFGVYTEDDDFLELFWSRVQNPSGTTNMDFELNRELCDGTAAHCANNGTTTNPVYVTPKRSTGDKLITYDLSKGGTVPSISIRTWTGSAWSSASVISGGTDPDALGSVNTSTIPASESAGLGQQDPFTFGEAAISFEALFGEGACGSFGSAYLKSRSSDSFTAELKDFVPPEAVQISNCPSGLTTTAVTPVTVGDPISDTAHLNVPAGTGGTITFHLWSNATCTTEVNTGLGAVTVNGPGDYNSGNYTTTSVGTFYWTAVYSGDTGVNGSSTACGDAGETSVVNPENSTIGTTHRWFPQDSATVTGQSTSATGTVTFSLYKNDSTCGATNENARVYGPDAQTLSGGTAATNQNTFSVSSVTAGDTYYWKAVYGGDAKHKAVTSCNQEKTTFTSLTNGSSVTSP
jgi:hypothetical protein